MVGSCFKCLMCGNCCRQYWDVIITKQDVLIWDQLGKDAFLDFIQINPLSISPAGLGDRRFGIPFVEIPSLIENNDDDAGELWDFIEFEKSLNRLKDFILRNHNYLGEGESNLTIHGYFSFFYPNEAYFNGMGERPIFSPKNFRVILKGINLGLKYILMFDALRHCGFLEGNLYSIHKLKPQACKMFPLDMEKKLRKEKHILNVHKGLKSLKIY